MNIVKLNKTLVLIFFSFLVMSSSLTNVLANSFTTYEEFIRLARGSHNTKWINLHIEETENFRIDAINRYELDSTLTIDDVKEYLFNLAEKKGIYQKIYQLEFREGTSYEVRREAVSEAERKKQIKLLQLPHNSTWANINISKYNRAKRNAIRSLKMSRNSTWTDVIQHYSEPGRLRIAEMLDLPKSSSWAGIYIHISEMERLIKAKELQLPANTPWSEIEDL